MSEQGEVPVFHYFEDDDVVDQEPAGVTEGYIVVWDGTTREIHAIVPAAQVADGAGGGFFQQTGPQLEGDFRIVDEKSI